MEKKNQVPKYPLLRFPEFTDEWKKCKISDYGTVVTGSTPSTKDVENYEDDGFLWASPADIDGNKFIERTKTTLSSKGFDKTRKLPPISVLAVCIGSSIGKLAMAKNEMATNQQINSIVSNPLHSPEFVYYAITSRFRSYLSAVAVQAVPIISKSTFERLPNSTTSLPEQRKIAALLSLIDERIEVQNAIIKEQEAQKAALIRHLFDRFLRFPEFTDEWKEVKLGEICPSIQSGKDKKEEGEIPLYGAAKQLAYTRSASYSPPLILIGRVGSVGQLQWIDIPCGVSDNALVIQKGEAETVDIRFLFYCLKMAHLEQYAGGSSQKVITASFLKSLPLHLPPLPEQKKIAALLSAIDERLDVERAYAEQLKQQKAYLLRQMFI